MIRYAFFIFVVSASVAPAFAATEKKSLTDQNCETELLKFCADQPPEKIWDCLKKNGDQPGFSKQCQKHLVDFPKLMSAKEQSFVAACKLYFASCKNTDGNEIEHKRARRSCIFEQFKTVSPPCKKASKEYISLLPRDWKPQGWKD